MSVATDTSCGLVGTPVPLWTLTTRISGRPPEFVSLEERAKAAAAAIDPAAAVADVVSSLH